MSSSLLSLPYPSKGIQVNGECFRLQQFLLICCRQCFRLRLVCVANVSPLHRHLYSFHLRLHLHMKSSNAPRFAWILQADLQKNRPKQVHRGVLRPALHIFPLELLDLHVVWPSLCLLWGDPGCHSQFGRCRLPISLCHPLHSLCEFCKKGEWMNRIISLF